MSTILPTQTAANNAPGRRPAVLARVGALLDAQAVWLTAIAAVFALQAVLIFTHQPWLDEWQALQIALQSPTLADLLENLRYEGHPPLWYLILRAAAPLVPPYWVLPAVLAPIAGVTIAVILFASPFSRWQRLCLVTGELLLFEYLAISRSLSLGVCLLVLAIAFRRSRWSWLAIGLLPMCDFLFGVLSAAFVLIQWKEGRWWFPGAAFWFASGILAALTVIPAADALPALRLGPPALEAYQWLMRLGLLLLPFPMTANNVPQWSADAPFGLGLLLGPLFLIFVFLQVRENPLHRLIFGSFLLLTLVFTVAVYPLQVRHLSLVPFLLILLKWRDLELGKRTDASFDAWLVASAACGLAVASLNLTRPFDTAAIAAKEIRRLDLQEKHWLAYPSSRAGGVSALTGIEFERPGAGCLQSFVRWNYETPIDQQWKLERFLRGATRLYGRIYLLTDRKLDMPSDLVRTLSYIPAGYEGQEFYLYVVAPNLPEHNVPLPKCAPANRLPLEVAPGPVRPAKG